MRKRSAIARLEMLTAERPVTGHSPVSNIEQFHSVCGAIFQAGRASIRWGILMPELQLPSMQTPNRHVGTARVWRRDRPCPSCGAEMHLFRRSPEPVYHGYEVQMFSCMKCDAEITRSADRMGKPHPSAVLIELETPSISYFGNNAKLFFKESVASRRLQPRLGTAR